MAAPVRDSTSGGHQPTTANFEYDDNEWDIGIGDLIIDLDADIEKTGVGEGMAAPKPGKMHSPVEHQATVDKGLKMKIKRTKPGTKHEIVKSGENGEKHSNSAKRGSSGHKRDKKHGEKPNQKDVNRDMNGSIRDVRLVELTSRLFPPIEEKEASVSGIKKVKSSASSGCGASSSNNNSGKSACVASTNSGGSAKQQNLSPSPHNLASLNSPPTLQQQQPAPSLPPALQQQVQQPILSPQTLPQQLQQHKPLQPPPLLPQSLPPQQSSNCLPSPPTLQIQVTSLPPTISPSITPPPNISNSLQNNNKELVDVCVGTSVGTITEPDCLGPCEPGTSVTLEGIVWHETEGVLVVNVTWRGKTYVGTLLDCTKHDWAPPRFCDSPTSDLDSRTPKGRGKRGRSAAHAANDLTNFTETRSSVHSKLRSNNATGQKGRRGPGAASPTPFVAPKADTTPGKRKTKTNEEEPPIKKKVPPCQPLSPLPPPVLLECPEPNCSKKYKHINGLKYHQSHAHGSPEDDEAKESATSEEEEQSPLPEIKKEEPVDLQIPILEEQLPEPEEKTVLRINTMIDEPIRINSVTPNTQNLTIIPDELFSTPPPEDDSHIPSQPPILTKVSQFKVKSPSVLMPEEKKPPTSPNVNKSSQPINHKKKNRKSPAGSPHPSPLEPPPLGIETGREEVQSPAYSDISDDAAPLLESEVEGKPKPVGDKKESGQSPQLQHYGMYPYYGQPPYLVPSVSEKTKEPIPEKQDGKSTDKDKKEGNGDCQQKLLSQHYYQYGSYQFAGYHMIDGGYPVMLDEKKEEKPVTSSTTLPSEGKPLTTSTLHIPNPSKSKSEHQPKEKHQNDNHQILKESIEMKTQVNHPSQPFLFQRPGQEVSRYYIYPDRKEGTVSTKATPPPSKSLPSPSPKHKDKIEDKKERREDEKKQEGVKPTMETQGPPPPPTSQYTYIHPGYMQSPHYGALPFDPNHPVYRGMNPMLVSSYPNSPYLHPLHSAPRYGPEDLSRSQSGKALDLLQHHASQYYSHPSHKIHELQERAIKSPTPKTSTTAPTPVTGTVPVSVPTTTSATVQVQSKPGGSEIKDTRSPPPQRHVHTHHHTHVGLGYPILASQYPAPYGAAVMATEHAAAVTSVPYQAK